jgi:hypothetical protein
MNVADILSSYYVQTSIILSFYLHNQIKVVIDFTDSYFFASNSEF